MMMGFSATSGQSKGLDTVEDASDITVDYIYSIVDFVNSTRGRIGEPMYNLLIDLNRTIFDVLPTQTRMQEYRGCLATVFSVMDVQAEITGALEELGAVLDNVTGINTLDTSLAQMNAAIATLPNLTAVDSNLRELNASVSSPPGTAQLEADFVTINGTINSLSNLDSLVTSLEALESSVSGFNTSGLRSMLVQYDSALNSMPNLTAMHYNLTDVTRSTPADLIAGLTQLENAVNALPDLAQLRQSLVSTNTSLNQIRANINFQSDILLLNTSLSNLPNMTRVVGSIDTLGAFINTTQQKISEVIAQVNQLGSAIAMLPNLNSVSASVSNVQYSVLAIANFNVTRIGNALLSLNSTLSQLSCVLVVFDDLERVNSSLVQLPPEMQQVTDVRAQVDRVLNDTALYHGYINDVYAQLDDVTGSLDNLPNFTSLLQQIADINSTLATLPNMSAVAADLTRINGTISDVPALGPYRAQILSLQSSMNVPDLNQLYDTLGDINRTIANVPPIDSYTSNVDAMNQTIDGIGTVIASVKTYINSNPNQQIAPPSLRTTILDKIVALNQTVNERPNVTDLVSKLDSVNASIASRPNISSIVDSIRDLNASLHSFPDIDTLVTSLRSVANVSSGNDQLNSVLSDSKLSSLDSTLSSLPNITGMRSQLAEANSSLNAVDVSEITQQLDFSSGSFNSTELLDQMDSAIDSYSQMPDFDEYIAKAADYLDDAGKQMNKVYAKRNDYEKKKKDINKIKNAVDGVRLLVVNIVLSLPFAVSLFGMCGMVFRKGCCSMVMALLLFPAMVLVLFFTALQMPLALLLTDNCPHIREIAHSALKDKQVNLSSAVDANFVEGVTERSVPLTNLFDHYTACIGQPPELLAAVTPHSVSLFVDREGYNLTTKVEELESGNLTGQALVLRQGPLNIINSANALVSEFDELVYEAVQLVHCSRTSRLYNAWINRTLCTELGGSWALTVVIFLLTALVSMIGVCFGVCGYKRFNPVNSLGDAAKREYKDLEGMRVRIDGADGRPAGAAGGEDGGTGEGEESLGKRVATSALPPVVNYSSVPTVSPQPSPLPSPIAGAAAAAASGPAARASLRVDTSSAAGGQGGAGSSAPNTPTPNSRSPLFDRSPINSPSSAGGHRPSAVQLELISRSRVRASSGSASPEEGGGGGGSGTAARRSLAAPATP
jgi:hypothetical protein